MSLERITQKLTGLHSQLELWPLNLCLVVFLSLKHPGVFSQFSYYLTHTVLNQQFFLPITFPYKLVKELTEAWYKL